MTGICPFHIFGDWFSYLLEVYESSLGRRGSNVGCMRWQAMPRARPQAFADRARGVRRWVLGEASYLQDAQAHNANLGCGLRHIAAQSCAGATAALAIAMVSCRCSTGTMLFFAGIGIEKTYRDTADRASASSKTKATWAGPHQVK